MRWVALLLIAVGCSSCEQGVKHAGQPAPTPHANARSYEFVQDVLRCLRLSRDTKDDEGMTDAAGNDREKGFLFAERLQRSGREMQEIMAPWQVEPEPRIAEVARQLHSAGSDLEEMAGSYRELLRGGDADEHSAAFKSRKEDLTGRLFSAATVAAHHDSNRTLLLSAEQMKAIVRLIETRLFSDEMQEYDQAPKELRDTYIAQPDLFSVIVIRNIYKRKLGVK